MQNTASLNLTTTPTVPTVLLTDFAPFSAVLQFFLGLETASIVTLTALTVAKVISPKATFAALGGSILKLSRVQVIAGASMNYGNAVNRRLEKQGDKPEFVSQPRKWGERVLGTPFVRHAGKLYLETSVFRPLSRVYILNGPAAIFTVDAEKLRPYLAKAPESARQVEAGVEKPVIWRDYRIDRLIDVRAGGGAIIHEISLKQAIANALDVTLDAVTGYDLTALSDLDRETKEDLD